MTAFFQPPILLLNPPILPETRGIQYELWKFYGGQRVGVSVVLIDGHYVSISYPSQDLLTGTEGIDYFLGGHEYIVSDPVADQLVEDGYGEEGDEGGQIEYVGSWGSHEDETWASQTQWGGM